MQIRIFEAGPFLNLGPDEDSSFHGGICISFNGFSTLHMHSENISYCFIKLIVSPDGSLGMFHGDSLTKMNLSFAKTLV